MYYTQVYNVILARTISTDLSLFVAPTRKIKFDIKYSYEETRLTTQLLRLYNAIWINQNLFFLVQNNNVSGDFIYH